MASLQTLMALGKAGTSTFLSLLRKVFLLIPFIYIFPLFMDNQVFTIILAEPIADVLSVAITIVIFSLQFKRTKRKCRFPMKSGHNVMTELSGCYGIKKAINFLLASHARGCIMEPYVDTRVERP